MESKNFTWVTAIVVMATGIFAYFHFSQQPAGQRSEVKSPAGISATGDQKFPARLWEDPFAATQRKTSGSIGPENLREQILKWKKSKDEVRLLGVLVDGLAYPEDKEARLRSRYAVNMAFAALDFKPVNSSHLGNVSLYKSFSVGEELNIPFEWFENQRMAALVLWLREQDFADSPLDRLMLLQKGLNRSGPAETDRRNQEEDLKLNIVGPRTFDVLEKLGEDLEASSAKGSPESREFVKEERSMPIYIGCSSFRCLLTDELWKHLWPQIRKEEYELANLLHLLHKELFDNRGIRPTDQVAIIYERDTSFGRTCCSSLCKEFSKDKGRPIITYAYVRGLDGLPHYRAEGETKSNEDESRAENPQNEKSNPAAKPASFEKPEGERRLDYAKRMAAALKQRCNGKKLRAVGILGNDFGDKLILLKALRREFSAETYFFTTELDARYLDPGVLPDTRNLLIASAYPFDPNELNGVKGNPYSDTKMVSPFRDSNQTAIFFACLNALKPSINFGPEPGVYEVGRKDIIYLSDNIASENIDKIEASEWFVLFFLTALGLFWWIRTFPFQIAGMTTLHPVKSIEISRNLAAFAIIVTGLLTIAAITYFASRGKEPFLLLDGVSIWPTELIRVAGVFLTIVFFIFAWNHHRIYRFNLWSKYFNPGKTEDKNASSKYKEFLREIEHERWEKWKQENDLGFWGRLRGLFAIPLIHYPDPELNSKTLSIEVLLRNYFMNGLFLYRGFRIAGWGLIFFLVLYPIVDVPLTPARGEFASTCDKYILYACIVCFWFLVLYVLDLTRLARSMIKKLGAFPSHWPVDYLTNLAQEKGTDKDFLQGYADVKFVANHTKESSQVVLYPFIVFSVMLVARSQLFERWSWPWSYTAVSILVILLIVLCSFSIRRAAAKVRKDAIEGLKSTRNERIASGQSEQARGTRIRQLIRHAIDGLKSIRNERIASGQSEQAKDAQIRQLIAEISDEAEGAYAPWFLDRAASAFLIPSAGVLIINVFEALFSPGYW
jgi:hypothetical protein